QRGEWCNDGSQCCSDNCQHGRCEEGTGGETCRENGAQCGAVDRCCSGLKCTSSHCIRENTCQQRGEWCNDGSQCCSDNCQHGRCEEGPGGEPCRENVTQCVSVYRCFSGLTSTTSLSIPENS